MIPYRSFGRRGKQRFGEWVTFAQAFSQLDSTHRPRLLIFLPPATGKVSAHHAFHGEHVQGHYDHRASRDFGRRGFIEAVIRDISQRVAPPVAESAQQGTFARNLRAQDVIEGTDPICGHQEHLVGGVKIRCRFRNIYGADFARIDRGPVREVGH